MTVGYLKFLFIVINGTSCIYASDSCACGLLESRCLCLRRGFKVLEGITACAWGRMPPVSDNTGLSEEMGTLAAEMQTDSASEYGVHKITVTQIDRRLDELDSCMYNPLIESVDNLKVSDSELLTSITGSTNCARPPINLEVLKAIERSFNPPDLKILHEL